MKYFQSISPKPSFIKFEINYQNPNEQKFQINPEINITKDKNIQFFIDLQNEFLKISDTKTQRLVLNNFTTTLRIIQSENSKKINKESKIGLSREKYRKKNIDYFELRGLDTISKYKYIFNSLL